MRVYSGVFLFERLLLRESGRVAGEIKRGFGFRPQSPFRSQSLQLPKEVSRREGPIEPHRTGAVDWAQAATVQLSEPPFLCSLIQRRV